MYEHFGYFEKMRNELLNDSQRVIVRYWKRFVKKKKANEVRAA